MKYLVVANWKCNPLTLSEAKKLFDSVGKGVKNIKNTEIVICPPFVYLPDIRHTKYNIRLGAQDCFWEDKGAFTGEVSPKMLKDFGVEYVIVGHSERRQILKETDEMVKKKLNAVLKANLKPILCIGETEKERKEGKTQKILKTQLEKSLEGIENWKMKIKNLILAYEPIWAIGTGQACQILEAKKVNLFIKKLFPKIKILYGGSINSQNAKNYIEKAGFQGLLVGGASLNIQEFLKIVKCVSHIDKT